MTDKSIFSGRVWKFGDNISTDHILPSRFMTMVEPHELAANCLAGIDAGFAGRIQPGDILVAGDNVGYGSSREHAPLSLKYAGISAVIARSFARIFYRNCYNLGIPAIVCPAFVDDVKEMEEAKVNMAEGIINNKTGNKSYRFPKPPAFLLEYIALGGLLPYLEKHLNNE